MNIRLPKDFNADDAPRVLAQARPVLELPPDAQLRVDKVIQSPRGTQIDFSYTTSVELDDDTLQEVAGVRVDVSSRGDLRFNANGALVDYAVAPADPRQLRAISDHVAKLIENGELYIAKPGERVDVDRLRALGKSWYLEQDDKGAKRLKRAWIA